MAEYIDRNQLIQRIKQEPTDGMYTEEILSAIDEIETADVAEVRRGKWEFINQSTNYLEPPIGDMCKCSECNFKIDVSETLFKFCPNCGVKMDLGDDEK